MQTILSEHKEPDGWVVKFINDDGRSTFRYIIPSGDLFAVVNPFHIHVNDSCIEYDLDSAIATATKSVAF